MNDQPRFLQIHTLTPYIGVLLNRDDVGQAKRLPLGGKTRGRVSSQCLKRHWRTAAGGWGFDGLGTKAVRSRQTFVTEVKEPLEQEGLDPALVAAAILAVQAELLGESKKAAAKKQGGEDNTDLETNQVIVLGRPEIEYIKTLVRTLVGNATGPKDMKDAARKLLDREQRENLKTMREAAGLDAALFGRMVTGDILARVDAAVHVAHAFTIHAVEAEPDYFTAVDDITQASGEQGSGHINISELTSGLYYSYVAVDLPLLVSNLEGCDRAAWTGADRTLAGQVTERLLHLIATVSPGAKLGSTAPYSVADTVLVEAGARQPRSLANAFYKPVPAGNRLREDGTEELLAQLGRIDRMYGGGEERRLATLIDDASLGGEPTMSLAELAAWAGAVAAGKAA